MTALPLNIPSRPAAAFTLLEVILAIVIALGILVVLLFFYQQATHLRAQALQETERIAAARLVMDRLTAELRTLRTGTATERSFIGRSNAIEFLKADVPVFTEWTGGLLGRSAVPTSDLKRIQYRLQPGNETNAGGLLRSEEAAGMIRTALPQSEAASVETPSAAVGLTPVHQEIQFLQFRYWTGTNWVDEWLLPSLPTGVDVRLGWTALSNETEVAESSADLFRRTIYVPAQVLADSVTTARFGSESSAEREVVP